MSSIFYSDLLKELHDKIKHSLEERKKLLGSFLYRVVIDKFIKSTGAPAVPDDEKNRIYKLKQLIDAFLSIHEKLHTYKEQENTLKFVKLLFGILDSNRDAIHSLIDDSGLSERHTGLDDLYIDYNRDIDQLWQLLNCLYSIASSWLEKTRKIYQLLSDISRQVFHVFGEAGFGKTNIACYVTEQLLSKKLPVILIPGSEIRNRESIQGQIISSIGLNSSMTFDKFIGILDSIGLYYGIKVPIVIDGLNETQPASTWNLHIHYIVDEIKKVDNVVLISTCRNAYANQVFGKEQIDESPYKITLEGFDKNIEAAIDKYFTKYRITIISKDYDKELFNNPLLLRIFSLANKGKSVSVNETGIYRAVGSYIDEIINRVATYNNDVNPQTKMQAENGLDTYSSALWKNRCRGVAYSAEAKKCFDPNYVLGDWHDTVTYKIIDEGLLFRNVHDDKEFAEFTHDLIGGYCIAKSLLSANGKDIASFLNSDDLVLRLTSGDSADKHPLAEDILKAMVFLAPDYTGKQLFMLVDNPEVVRAALQILRIVISDPQGIYDLNSFFCNISPDNPILPHLLESVLVEILRHDENIVLAELLSSVLINLSSTQVDLNWSEAIRRLSKQISPYLFETIDKFSSCGGDDNLYWQITFISFLLSSTNRYIRDMATKALVVIGRRYPDVLFEVFINVEPTKDIFILERMIASLVGALLTSDNKDLILKVCQHMETQYIKNLRTSHVLILDYVITLLNYAVINFGYSRSVNKPATEGLFEWQRDPDCVTTITDDWKATWGFGPVGYDFAKYKIGSFLSIKRFEKDSDLPSLKDALAMVVWRAKELGYTKELFEAVDRALMNHEDNRYGYRSANTSTEYRKKYRDIAFYELYGHNLIKGLSKDFKDGDGFRVSPAYIDPTFPHISSKRQMITCCFLPKKTDAVQAWIDSDDLALMEDHYIRSDIEKDDSEWVMLYGHLVQEGMEKSRIDIGVYTIMVPEDSANDVMDKIKRNEFMPHLLAENYNVLAGEIPWSENYLDDIRREKIEGSEVEIYLPVSEYHQETKSEIEIVRRAYVPSRRLAHSLDLRINLDDFNLYEKSGKKASAYIHDNYSSYVYIRNDLLQQYLSDTRRSMIWIEIALKYAAFGKNETKYNPSFKDYISVKIFLVD